jgi:hypothetical protein
MNRYHRVLVLDSPQRLSVVCCDVSCPIAAISAPEDFELAVLRKSEAWGKFQMSHDAPSDVGTTGQIPNDSHPRLVYPYSSESKTVFIQRDGAFSILLSPQFPQSPRTRTVNQYHRVIVLDGTLQFSVICYDIPRPIARLPVARYLKNDVGQNTCYRRKSCSDQFAYALHVFSRFGLPIDFLGAGKYFGRTADQDRKSVV